MAASTDPTNVRRTVINPRTAVVAAGHSGHTITVTNDYAYWCTNDSAYVNEDLITTGKCHK